MERLRDLSRSLSTVQCGGVCDDGNMELEEMETSQQQHLILVIQVCAGFSAVWPARGSVM